MVKFGNRTYRIPAGTVIEQLQQAGYTSLNETWKPGRCVSSTPPLLTKSSMFCSYTDGDICTPVVLLEKLPGRSSHPNTHGKLQTKKEILYEEIFLSVFRALHSCLPFVRTARARECCSNHSSGGHSLCKRDNNPCDIFPLHRECHIAQFALVCRNSSHHQEVAV